MRAFIGSLKPVHDETLSSWLSRMYHKRYFDGALTSEFEQLAAKDPNSNGDSDFLYESPTFLSYFTAVQQREIEIRFRMPKSDVTLPSSSCKYCSECFQDDIGNLLVPIWRRSWRINGAAVCMNHPRPVLLSRLIQCPTDLRDRGWQGFKEYLESPASRLRANFPIMNSSSDKGAAQNEKLLQLVKRVQRWYQAHTSDHRSKRLSRNSLRFLLGIWLHQADTPKLSPGIARTCFQSPLRQSRPNAGRLTAPEASIDTATPRELAVAYWLMGVAYELITREEAVFIRETIRTAFSPFPTTQMQIAASTTANYLDEGLSRLIHEAKSALTLDEFREVSWVLIRLIQSKS
ncbi:TniQ family protein [Pseudomonas fluorescens]|uniref:TniQ domain-containing protein n=1 Tax=Pseudomonas fluorescens TaxID=294 RepID=A0A5E7HDW2_PSEFL|nr:TniQ family protein [Pseudomonas fluorescens]VVO62068.1 hypothetical protein PS847_00851 [Pseudomonas fluorescens]